MEATLNIRYVVTHINRLGLRQMSDPHQGRYTKATHGEAVDRLNELKRQEGDLSAIKQSFGDQAIGTFESRPVKCYAGHNDPMTTIFD